MLDSIKTSQDDEARINLTRLEDWVWQDWNHDITFFFDDSCLHECIFCLTQLIDWIVD